MQNRCPAPVRTSVQPCQEVCCGQRSGGFHQETVNVSEISFHRRRSRPGAVRGRGAGGAQRVRQWRGSRSSARSTPAESWVKASCRRLLADPPTRVRAPYRRAADGIAAACPAAVMSTRTRRTRVACPADRRRHAELTLLCQGYAGGYRQRDVRAGYLDGVGNIMAESVPASVIFKGAINPSTWSEIATDTRPVACLSRRVRGVHRSAARACDPEFDQP